MKEGRKDGREEGRKDGREEGREGRKERTFPVKPATPPLNVYATWG